MVTRRPKGSLFASKLVRPPHSKSHGALCDCPSLGCDGLKLLTMRMNLVPVRVGKHWSWA